MRREAVSLLSSPCTHQYGPEFGSHSGFANPIGLLPAGKPHPRHPRIENLPGPSDILVVRKLILGAASRCIMRVYITGRRGGGEVTCSARAIFRHSRILGAGQSLIVSSSASAAPAKSRSTRPPPLPLTAQRTPAKTSAPSQPQAPPDFRRKGVPSCQGATPYLNSQEFQRYSRPSQPHVARRELFSLDRAISLGKKTCSGS